VNNINTGGFGAGAALALSATASGSLHGNTFKAITAFYQAFDFSLDPRKLPEFKPPPGQVPLPTSASIFSTNAISGASQRKAEQTYSFPRRVLTSRRSRGD